MALLKCISPLCTRSVESNKLACQDHWQAFDPAIKNILFEAWLSNDWYFLRGLAGELSDEDIRNRPRHPRLGMGLT